MQLTKSYADVFPRSVLDRYQFHETRNAAAILLATNHSAFSVLAGVLDEFALYTEDLLTAGGQESNLAARLNGLFRRAGWREARVDTRVELDLILTRYRIDPSPDVKTYPVTNEGYKVDNFVDRVALDVEWNAKDGNLDRDLGAYRFLYEQGLIDVGVIITRTLELRELGRRLADEAGWPQAAGRKILGTTTTTNTAKLLPRLTRGSAGGCPVLAVAICDQTWAGDGVSAPLDAPLAHSDDEGEMPVIA